MTNKFYSGIGSRSTPSKVQDNMKNIAIELNKMGYWLRSGNADGADQAFARGVSDEKAQIWLPWVDFNIGFQRMHPNHTYKIELDKEAWDSVNIFHPYGSKLSPTSRLFMCRNYRQVRGLKEPDSQFVICWTEGGKEVGGTAQALRIANHYKIPIFNMYDLSVEEILKEVNKLNLLQ